jgi:hypothetical protein
MKLDYDTPRIETRLVAEAAGMKPATMHSYYHRQHFRTVGNVEKHRANGMPDLFSLRDAIGIAVAHALIKAGASARAAFEAAMFHFAFGSAGNGRNPGELFDEREHGDTFMAFYPESGRCQVFAVDSDAIPRRDLFPAGEEGEDEGLILIKLNGPVKRAVAALASVDARARLRSLGAKLRKAEQSTAQA